MIHRAAFECEDGMVRIVPLCSGCLSDVMDQLGGANRRWIHAIEAGSCEFCEYQIRADVESL